MTYKVPTPEEAAHYCTKELAASLHHQFASEAHSDVCFSDPPCSMLTEFYRILRPYFLAALTVQREALPEEHKCHCCQWDSSCEL